MNNIYETGEYLAQTETWHAEDSPWKAAHILRMIQSHNLHPSTIGEVGCGAGGILTELQKHLPKCAFEGYDISPQAIGLCRQTPNCSFFCEDIFSQPRRFDVVLIMDVFEHVPDYMGFVEQSRKLAEYKIYHIPLDLHVSGILRNSILQARESIGHLHYFTAETALATLRDTGHEIVDWHYTNGALNLYRIHPSFKRAIANIPRWLIAQISVPFAARVLGGYSLLVLAK